MQESKMIRTLDVSLIASALVWVAAGFSCGLL